MPHHAAHDVVRSTEGRAVTHEVVGKVGGGGVTRSRSFAHAFAVGFYARHHFDEGLQRILHRVDRVKDRFLVFLQILVVGKGQALHKHCHRDEVAHHASALAAGGFRHVRILLLGHDGRPRRKAIRQLNEGEGLAHPVDEFFGKARDVHHHEPCGSREFNAEIAVAHGV